MEHLYKADCSNHCSWWKSEVELLALAAELRATGVDSVKDNETEQAADAHVPLQSKSTPKIPVTEHLRNVWHPGGSDRLSISHMPPARANVKPQDFTALCKVAFSDSQ